MIRNAWIWAGAAALFAALSLPAQKLDSAESLLQAATKKELVDGNLAGAIEGYKKAFATAKGNRAVAAQALLQLGQCYRKQAMPKRGSRFNVCSANTRTRQKSWRQRVTSSPL